MPIVNRLFAGFWCALVFAAVAAGTTVAADNPPTTRRATTNRDLYRQSLAFNRLTLPEAYKSVGKRDPKWDAQAVAYLEGVASQFANGTVPDFYKSDEVFTRAKAIPPGEALVAAGCDDPLVLYCHAAMVMDVGRGAEALPLLRRAEAGLRAAKYPPYRVFVAAARLARLSADPTESSAAAARALADGVGLFCGPRPDIERRLVLAAAWPYYPTRAGQQRFAEALTARPDADPWLKGMVLGRLHTALAWDRRGSGFANAVTPEGWEGFFKHLKLAADGYAAAWKAAPNLPEAPTEMIRVAMGGGDRLGEDPNTWFERALAAQVDFQDAYSQMMAGPLLPRWGGSYEAMMQMADACVAQPRYDTIIPWQYVVTVKQAGMESGRPWMLVAEPQVYDNLVRVAEGYDKTLGKGRGDFYKTLHAAVAWRAGKLAEARKVLDEMTAAGRKPDPSAFAYLDADHADATISMVYLLTGPHGKAVAAAMNKVRSGDAAGGLADLRAGLAKLGPDDAGRLFLADAVDTVEGNLKFAAGEWAPVRVQPSLRGWQVSEGNWWGETGGAAVAHFNAGRPGGQSLSLLLNAKQVGRDLGPAFEIAVNVEHLGEPGKDGMAGGLIIQRRGDRRRGMIVLDKARQRAMFTFEADSHKWPKPRAFVKENSELRLRVNGHTLTLFVDGKQAGPPYTLPAEVQGAFDVGLGGIGSGQAGAGFKFTNLRVRNGAAAEPGK